MSQKAQNLDDAFLATLGYKQELKRQFTPFELTRSGCAQDTSWPIQVDCYDSGSGICYRCPSANVGRPQNLEDC